MENARITDRMTQRTYEDRVAQGQYRPDGIRDGCKTVLIYDPDGIDPIVLEFAPDTTELQMHEVVVDLFKSKRGIWEDIKLNTNGVNHFVVSSMCLESDC